MGRHQCPAKVLTADAVPGNAAIDQIMTLIRNQSQSSWTEDWEFVSYYNWTGSSPNEAVPVNNGGNGEPVLANGLIASNHRPSDDICVFSESLACLACFPRYS